MSAPWEQPPVPGKPPGWGSNVQPRRRPMREKAEPWECDCPRAGHNPDNQKRVNPYYLANCLDCKTHRP